MYSRPHSSPAPGRDVGSPGLLPSLQDVSSVTKPINGIWRQRPPLPQLGPRCQPCLLVGREAATAWPWPCFVSLLRCVRWGEESSYLTSAAMNWLVALRDWCVFKAETCASGTSSMNIPRPTLCPPTLIPSVVLSPAIPLLWMTHCLWLALCNFPLGPWFLGPPQGEAESRHHVPPQW